MRIIANLSVQSVHVQATEHGPVASVLVNGMTDVGIFLNEQARHLI